MVELFKGKRSVRVIYYYCRHLDVFENDPDWSIEELTSGRPPSGGAAHAALHRACEGSGRTFFLNPGNPARVGLDRQFCAGTFRDEDVA